MIECNPLLGGNGRTRDGVKGFTRFSKSWYIKATGRITTEEPIGMPAADYVQVWGRLRCDQTGKIYRTAHDIEDSPYTYTEVFPDPAYYSELSSYGFNTNVYPQYSASKTYNKGDIVTYTASTGQNTSFTYICDEDETIGIAPNIYGWSYYKPFIERRFDDDIVWKSVDELYPE